jgi:hypothetical protein
MNKLGSKRSRTLILPMLIMLLSGMLTGCSNYSSSFSCPDASGLNCMPVSLVDRQIDSGEIERVGRKLKCRGGKCSSTAFKGAKDEIKPELRYSEPANTSIEVNSED